MGTPRRPSYVPIAVPFCILFVKHMHPQRSEEVLTATALSDARRLRRQRKLNAVEIPECDVTVTDELLGKGGFGAVYLADYNGRNAAAKVSYCTIVSRHKTQQLAILRVVNTTVFPL